MQIPEQTAALATFAHEILMGAIKPSEQAAKARKALERAGLLSLDDVVALATTKATAPVAAGNVAPNHRLDLEYARRVLENAQALLPKNDGAQEEIASALEGLKYVISRIQAPAPPPGEAIGEPVAMDKTIALAEKCSAEVGRYDGKLVWVKFHSLASLQAFEAGVVIRAALRAATPATPSSQDAPRAVPAGLSDAQRLDWMILDVMSSGDLATAALHDEDGSPINFEKARGAIDRAIAALAASAPGAQPQPGTGATSDASGL